MKKWLITAHLFIYISANAQNEFAATAFYNDFKKITADAFNGFTINKGAKKNAEFEDLAEEYKVKLSLLPADSGKIVFPKNGAVPYALYYFEPTKTRLKSDQKSVDLRDAIFTAYAKPLYTLSETKIIDEKVYSDTWFFTTDDTKDKKAALFRLSIFPKDNRYYLTLEIRGKNP